MRARVFPFLTRLRLTIMGAGVLVLSGCSLPGPQKTSLDEAGIGVPADWALASESGATQPGSSAVSNSWIEALGSPSLVTLVDEAMTGNLDLKRVSALAEAAYARARIADSALLPRVDADGNASRTGEAVDANLRSTSSTFDAGLNVSWEIDLWDRLSGAARAGALDASAARADYHAARLAVAADVARAWFNAVETNLQVELAEETVRNFKDNLKVVEDGFDRGINSALDIRLERANLATAESQVQERRVARSASVRLVETLVGRYPSGKLELSAQLSVPVAVVPAGLPAEMLNRRPDLKAAADRLSAADSRFDVARKNWLPTVSLTGRGGLRSSELSNLLDLNSLLWTLAGSLAAPIFRGGELQAERDGAQAVVGEALATYAQTVLTAFREVESALDAEHLLESQEDALRLAASESEEAASLALERYRSGLVDIVTWLDARNRTFDAKSALVRTNNERLQNRIALHLALGGGFALMDAETSVDGPPNVTE